MGSALLEGDRVALGPLLLSWNRYVFHERELRASVVLVQTQLEDEQFGVWSLEFGASSLLV